VLQRVLLRHLAPQFEPVPPTRVRYRGLQRLARPCAVLLSALAHAGHTEPEATRAAFEQGRDRLGLPLVLLDPAACGLSSLDGALAQLDTVAFPLKRDLLEAGAACVSTDGRVTVHEAELLRGVADSLGCPVPPRLPATEA